MKKSEFRALIREEVKKTLNEGAILKAITPGLTGELKAAVAALENSLQQKKSILNNEHAEELAYLIIDIIDAAKEEERKTIEDF